MSELFKEIKRLPVSKEIMNQLKELILNGKIKCGEKIPSERELTEKFNVSRNMVREAIRGLETMGYLEIQQGAKGGAFVREFTHDRFANIFLDFYLADKLTVQELVQARLFIEPEIARLAANNIDNQGSLLLLEALKKEDLKEDMEERVENLAAVHIVLAKLCGNTFYEITVTALIAITHEIILNTFQKGKDALLHGLGQHDTIVKAVLDGNATEASKAMTQHLTKFAKAFGNLDVKYKHRRSVP